jgi:hypothetical protein
MIKNGFIRLVSGRWVNLIKVESFEAVKLNRQEGYGIVAYMKSDRYVVSKDFESKEDAHNFLDDIFLKEGSK